MVLQQLWLGGGAQFHSHLAKSSMRSLLKADTAVFRCQSHTHR